MTHYKFESNLKVIHQVGRAWETLAVAHLHLQCNVTAPKSRGLRFGGGLPAVPASLRLLITAGAMVKLYSFLFFHLRHKDPKLRTHQSHLVIHWRGSN